MVAAAIALHLFFLSINLARSREADSSGTLRLGSAPSLDLTGALVRHGKRLCNDFHVVGLKLSYVRDSLGERNDHRGI